MTNTQWVTVLFLGALWGVSFLFTEILLEILSVYTIVFMRVFISAVCLTLYTVYHFKGYIIQNRKLFALSLRGWGDLLVLALLNSVLPFLFITYGQTFITGGLASILNSSTAFFTIVVASVFFADERLTLHRIIGVIIAIMGVTIAIGYQEILNISPKSVGGIFVLMGTFCYALATTWTKIRLQKHPICVSTTVMMIHASIIMFFVMLFTDTMEFHLITPILFMNIFIYAIISTVIAFPLLLYMVGKVGAGNVGISTMATVPSAIILGIVFLGENIFFTQILGFLIIVSGLIIIDGRIISTLYKK